MDDQGRYHFSCGRDFHRKNWKTSYLLLEVGWYTLGKRLVDMELLPVKIRQVQNAGQDEEFQKVYEALQGRVDLEKPILLRDTQEHPDALDGRKAILGRFGSTSMSGKYIQDPPVRGPFGEERISLIEWAVPVSRNTYRIGGERGEVHKKMVKDLIASRKVKLGSSPWN